MEKLDEERMVSEPIASFRELRDRLYGILPEDCFLKPRKVLAMDMLVSISPKALDKGLISREDACLFCSMDCCPWNGKVSWKLWRFFKVLILGRIFVSPLSRCLKNYTVGVGKGAGRKK